MKKLTDKKREDIIQAAKDEFRDNGFAGTNHVFLSWLNLPAPYAAGVDAGEPGGLFVGTHGHDIAPEHAAAEHELAGKDDGKRNKPRRRETEHR